MIQNGRMNNMAEKNDQKVKESVESKMEQFYKKLPELLAIAKKKKNMLEYQEISDYFKEFNLTPEQIEKVLEYLEANHVDVLRIADDDDILIDDEDTEADIEVEKLDLTVPDGVSIEDPVRMYLKEIGKVPLLTAEEEIDLAKDMEDGAVAQEKIEILKGRMENASEEEKAEMEADIKAEQKLADRGAEAKKRLAEANLRLVVSIAKRYVGRGMLFLERQ